MARPEKLYMRVASAPANARFEDVVYLAEAAGFVLVRQHGSHQLFRHVDKPALRLTLQEHGGQGKEYQVQDLLRTIEREHLWRW